MKKIFIFISFPTILLLGIYPIPGQGFEGAKELLIGWGGAGVLLTEIIIAITLSVFFIGLAKFVLRAGDEEARRGGKKVMMWGIISMFVIVSIWGIVEFLQDDLLPGADFTSPVILPNQAPPIGPIGPPLPR